ncbi:MAG: hypothetical protein JWL82_191, partial [Parcubacteria group bacterium]|nr:hypothetical protein [Parcubacteria group bacterium]
MPQIHRTYRLLAIAHELLEDMHAFQDTRIVAFVANEHH